MSGAIAATDDSVVITVEYNPEAVGELGPGLGWAILHDNRVLGWSGTAPVVPMIIGTLPGAGPATDPVMSPAWAQYTEGTVFVPDMWRGSVAEFFTLVATNNDAQRKVYAKFYTPNLAMLWNQWAMGNPLALTDPPNVAPDVEASAEKVEERRILAARRIQQAESDRVTRNPVNEADRIEAERIALARRPESEAERAERDQAERVEFRRSAGREQPAREA